MKTKDINWQTIRIFWRVGLKNKGLLYLALLFPIGNILYNTVVPLIISKMLAAIAQVNGNPAKYIPSFIIVALIGVVFNRFGFIALLKHQAKTMAILQVNALDTLLKHSLSFHNNNVGGKLVSDAIDYPAAYSQLAGQIYATLIPFAVTLIAGVLIVFWSAWILGLVMLAMIVFAFGSAIYESNRRRPIRNYRLKFSKQATAHTADTILNVQTVKTFATEKRELKKQRDLNDKLEDLRLRDWSDSARKGSNRITVLLFMQLILLTVSIHLTKSNPELLGTSIFAFSFTILLATRLFEINTILRTVEDSLLQAQPMTEIMAENIEVKDVVNAPDLKVSQGLVSFNNVDFEYQDAKNQPVFVKLNLEVKPGEKIGLVGPSGGGKSTLTRLLLRFEDIVDGTIAIDGQDISQITQDSLRQSISYVPQEPLLFHRSLMENIIYGGSNATEKDVVKASIKAHAHEFIDKLPKKYDTIVGERGVKLSGGQRQRVAIARAILKNAPILVLDEATSALDSESEKLIQVALLELMKDRTTIVIAHRLSTIQHMDRIIVLDEGKIIEEGSHKKLLKQKGLYAKLWAHQSGGFLED